MHSFHRGLRVLLLMALLCLDICSLYACQSKSSKKVEKYGIDVSHHNGTIDWVQTGNDSLAVFSKDDKRGYFNVNTGEVIIEPTFKHAWIFSEGLAGVVKNDMVGFINSKGETVIDFQYPYRGNSLSSFVFHDGRCVVANADQKIGAIDTLGN